MKKMTVAQLRDNDVVGDLFAVVACDRKTTNTNKPFLTATFADATGQINGVAWDNVDRLAAIIVPDTIVRIEASVSSYKGDPQLKILDARPLKASDKIDMADFMPKTPHDIDHLYRQLLQVKNSVADPMVRALLDHFFDDAAIAERFRKHPAAKRMHHAYVGGLLEHTLCVANACIALAANYPFLNRDVLVAGALLHDIGKLEEMASGITTEYTVHGQLVGHLTIGSDMIGRAAAGIKGFPQELAWQLQHLALSHHGQLEFGSPVVPVTLEALALHVADMLDAQLFQARAAIDADTNAEADFTRRALGLDRSIYKRTQADDGKAAPVAPAVPKAARERQPSLMPAKPEQESLL